MPPPQPPHSPPLDERPPPAAPPHDAASVAPSRYATLRTLGLVCAVVMIVILLCELSSPSTSYTWTPLRPLPRPSKKRVHFNLDRPS